MTCNHVAYARVGSNPTDGSINIMKYIRYRCNPYPLIGWEVIDTKALHSDLCGKGWNGFCNAILCWLWYLGVPAKIVFKKLRKNK